MKQFLIIALVAAMLLLLGCAGQQPAPQAPAQQQNNQQPPAPPAGDGQQTQQSSGSPLDELLGSLGGTSGWKVAYTITGSEMPNALQMTQYMKGTDKFRTDSTFEGTESRTYLLGNDIYSCTNSGGWTCFKFSGQMSGDDSFKIEKNLKDDSSKYTVTADGTKQVAGVTATCYKIVSSDSTTRYCVYDSVPLYVMSTGTSNGRAYTSEMTATSYSKSVSDADFVLPATAQELPSIGGSGSSGDSDRDICESACSSLEGDARDQCEASCPAG